MSQRVCAFALTVKAAMPVDWVESEEVVPATGLECGLFPGSDSISHFASM
jgi:hypothetical protein